MDHIQHLLNDSQTAVGNVTHLKCVTLLGIVFVVHLSMKRKVFFLVEELPATMHGLKMTPTAKGNNVILTHFKSIYTLEISKSKYQWIKLQHDLSISRQFHVQLLVPASTIQC